MAPWPGVPGENLGPSGRSLGRGRPALGPRSTRPQDCILPRGGCGVWTRSRGGLTFLGWGQHGGRDTLGLGTTLALHSQGWTPLESRDSWGSCQQLLCLSCHPARCLPAGKARGLGGSARGVRWGHRQKSTCPLPPLPVAPYSIKINTCSCSSIANVMAFQALAPALIHQNPSRDSREGRDLWSFHLEGLAVPICPMLCTVL